VGETRLAIGWVLAYVMYYHHIISSEYIQIPNQLQSASSDWRMRYIDDSFSGCWTARNSCSKNCGM